ncbi:TonB-dependent receptor [Flavobacteriaceae bacterium R38]|nr:TonB-dependent receptor [Flavobacteriaceae bacterium R38]
MRLKDFKLFILLFFTGIVIVSAQYSFSGKISNDKGEILSGAEVYLKEIEKLSITDSQGIFTFENIKAGTYNLVVFSFGYRIKEQEIVLDKNTTLNITLDNLGEELSEVVLTQQREKLFALKQLKKVEGTAIYAGKKSEVVVIDQITGNLGANNSRQIYSQVVGLNIYENGDAGLQLNIGGRGLDPNRTSNFNTRQNGYDISADVLGYPESYYTPPAEALSEIQVVRGAASLQYGTQFGGLLNFVFKKPNPDKPIEWISRQTVGSFGLLTSFNSLSGTIGKFSYYTYFNYKEGSSFRPNSDFSSRNYFGSFGYQFNDKTKVTFEATLQNYLAQQPGGITDNQFQIDPTFSNRTRNWFDVDWRILSLRLDHKFSVNTDFSLNLFTLDASRSALGIRDNRVTTEDFFENPRELLVDDFFNWGAEARLLTRYKIKDKDAVFLIGSKYYQADNEQVQGPGNNLTGPDFEFAFDEFPAFERQSDFTFPNLNISIFGENIFNITDRWTVVPGFRFEHIRTESDGSFRNIALDLAGNIINNEEIRDDRVFNRNFVLLGVGTTYKLNKSVELYGNFSENYRSITFNDIRVTNPTFIVDPNITDEQGFSVDIGARGRFKNILSYDVSLFGLSYRDRLGEINASATGDRILRVRGNIGDAFIYGIESFADWNLKNTFFPEQDDFKLNVFLNLALTKSEYTRATLSSISEIPEIVNLQSNFIEGNQVEFIPDVNLKTGVNFGYKDFLGSLQYTYLSEQFTDAANSPSEGINGDRGIEGEIPSYGILDLSLSYSYKRWKLEAGINNLLDESYFVRRATGYPGPGIIPSEPRTFYTTLQFKL